VRTLQITVISIGALLLLVALLANVLGLSTGDGLSRNQIAFGAAGLALIGAGLLGRRFPGFYRGAAVMLLNIVIIIILVDFLALVMVKLIDPERFIDRADKLEHGLDEENERGVTISSYVPYVLWRSEPSYEGDPVTIDGAGRRITPGSSQAEDAFRVFMFGGSAIWGANVEDSCTVPAYLLDALELELGRPVSMQNLAQNAHTSTQEIIELMLELRKGNIPDLVIFYDGYNDVWGACESGIPGMHHSYEAIAARIEGRDAGFQSIPASRLLLQNSNIWLLITSLRGNESLLFTSTEVSNYVTMGIDMDRLAEAIVEVYFDNCSLVEHLSLAYGFDAVFVWQPVLWCGEKPLTVEEQDIWNGTAEGLYSVGSDMALRDLMSASYGIYESGLPDSAKYLSLHSVFDSVEEQVYTDFTGAHITPAANRMIAGKLLDILVGHGYINGEQIDTIEIEE